MKACLGLLTAELHIPGSHSLKDRRSVVNSLKDRIRKRFNVSVSESSTGEVWQRADLNIACVAETEAVVDSMLRSIVHLIDEDPRCEAHSPRIEYYE